MTDVYVEKVRHILYPSKPFSPSSAYVELTNLPYHLVLNEEKNEVYEAVRNTLYQLGFDREHFGTIEWNPLLGMVKKGGKVLIKPNLVRGDHPNGDKFVISMVTNASVIRPLVDYVLLATEGDANITIGDVPLQDCNWEHVIEKSGLRELVSFYKTQGISINLLDMRLQVAHKSKFDVIDYKIDNVHRTKEMYSAVDLYDKSELIEIIDKSNDFEITDYGKGTVSKHHNREHNEYLVPNEILEADLFINVPKLKTHRKAGYTCALKNLIGINGDKSWIAHHTRGVFKGDEFNVFQLKTYLMVRVWTSLKNYSFGIKIANLIRRFYQTFIWKGRTYKQVTSEGNEHKYFFEGSWYGNDTLWRCIKDLNKIVLYADKDGKMRDCLQRQYLCIVDAVLAGEGEGPMEQKTKAFGVIMGGTRAGYVDYVATKLMKYDYRNIPVVRNAFVNRWWSIGEKQPNELQIASNIPIDEIADYFEPTAGWKEKLTEYEG